MPVTGATLLLFPPKVVWPYFAGVVLLAIGLMVIPRRKLSQAPPLDKAIALGALFFAIPMAVFGADHFTFAKGVAALVPPWMPAHLFWTYFVGVALTAAALSITIGRYSNPGRGTAGMDDFLLRLTDPHPQPNCEPRRSV